MKPSKSPLPGLLAAAALSVHASGTEVIVNGDFETGDFSGWTVTGASYSIESTAPLSGDHAARQIRVMGSSISQTFTPFTDSATVSFLFSADYPSPFDGDPVLHLFLEGDTGRINVRVAVATGDLQVLNRFNNVVIGWESTGINGLALDGTPHAVTITLNGFGAGASYDITVSAATATGLTVFDNGAPSDLRRLRFEANSNAKGGFTLIDNVSVTAPSPASTLAVTISPTPDIPGSYDFTWNSQPGKTYDLVTSTDLSTPPSTWPVWQDQSDIPATPPVNTVTDVPGGGDPKRFFSIIGKIRILTATSSSNFNSSSISSNLL